MKARSPKLAQYLEETGALHGSPEEIARAKAEYRKAYKAEYKKKNAARWKELRPLFLDTEYATVQAKANVLGLVPTAYLKQVALSYDTGIVPDKDTLHHVLQALSMAAIRLEQEKHPAAKLLTEAEQRLITYLKNH